MQKQKKGFWLFIFSLIPGAGEMYMGFKKQGLSIMLLFWSIFAFGAGTGMDWIIMFFPIVWFYSFFNVHNLKSLSEEEFYSIEDNYILHLDEFLGDADAFLKKYRKAAAILLIVFGGSILWNAITDTLYWILPKRLADMINHFSYRLPQIIIAAAIIFAGVYLLSNKKIQLSGSDVKEKEDEHFWEPYRPYQQTNGTSVSKPVVPAPEAPSRPSDINAEPALSVEAAPSIGSPSTETEPDVTENPKPKNQL